MVLINLCLVESIKAFFFLNLNVLNKEYEESNETNNGALFVEIKIWKLYGCTFSVSI